jgi:hypothetical protein
MRTFSCFAFDNGQAVAGSMLIITESLQRARELARRELLKSRDAISIEISEGADLLWTETAQQG